MELNILHKLDQLCPNHNRAESKCPHHQKIRLSSLSDRKASQICNLLNKQRKTPISKCCQDKAVSQDK